LKKFKEASIYKGLDFNSFERNKTIKSVILAMKERREVNPIKDPINAGKKLISIIEEFVVWKTDIFFRFL